MLTFVMAYPIIYIDRDDECCNLLRQSAVPVDIY